MKTNWALNWSRNVDCSEKLLVDMCFVSVCSHSSHIRSLPVHPALNRQFVYGLFFFVFFSFRSCCNTCHCLTMHATSIRDLLAVVMRIMCQQFCTNTGYLYMCIYSNAWYLFTCLMTSYVTHWQDPIGSSGNELVANLTTFLETCVSDDGNSCCESTSTNQWGCETGMGDVCEGVVWWCNGT